VVQHRVVGRRLYFLFSLPLGHVINVSICKEGWLIALLKIADVGLSMYYFTALAAGLAVRSTGVLYVPF
jgi:hypothetical protein